MYFKPHENSFASMSTVHEIETENNIDERFASQVQCHKRCSFEYEFYNEVQIFEERFFFISLVDQSLSSFNNRFSHLSKWDDIFMDSIKISMS